MKRLIVVLSLLAAACASENTSPRTYDNNDAELAVGFAARMSCSCMFVMNMPQEHCLAWVKASPAVAGFTVDMASKTVEATALISFAAKAHFVDERRGCVLE